MTIESVCFHRHGTLCREMNSHRMKQKFIMNHERPDSFLDGILYDMTCLAKRMSTTHILK